MNSKSGYCIARYGTCDGVGMYGMSKVDSIMLKYRPIAPKPVAAGSCGSSTGDDYIKCGRSKRKYVRVNKTKKKKDNFKRSGGERKRMKSSPLAVDVPVVTLPLLPETPDQNENKPVFGFPDLESLMQTRRNKYFDKKKSTPVVVDAVPQQQPVLFIQEEIKLAQSVRRPHVVSSVTVECVTDTWVDTEGLGCTDEERVKNMEKDTCPGFISDGQDRVVWMNKAYRQMAGVGHVVDGDDMIVVLVRKDKLTAPLPVTYPGFTCKVKVTCGTNNQQQTPSPLSPTLTLPCDVWRMGRGAYAWRLDVKAALSLGR